MRIAAHLRPGTGNRHQAQTATRPPGDPVAQSAAGMRADMRPAAIAAAALGRTPPPGRPPLVRADATSHHRLQAAAPGARHATETKLFTAPYPGELQAQCRQAERSTAIQPPQPAGPSPSPRVRPPGAASAFWAAGTGPRFPDFSPSASIRVR